MHNKLSIWHMFHMLAFMLCLLAPAVMAHHPVAAKFDPANTRTLSGRITAIDWANPHVHLFIQVDESLGIVGNWAVELPDTITLSFSGWSPDDVAVGEYITVYGPIAKNGSEQVWGERITNNNGFLLFNVDDSAVVNTLANIATGPTPRWSDGKPRLGPPPGQIGYWLNTGSGSLLEDGQTVSMDAQGLLKNLDDAARVAPFQDWARDLYILRQQESLASDPGYLFCIPPGGPRQFQQTFGLQFLEQHQRNRITMLMGGANRNWRLIYTDGREQISQVGGNDDNPLFFGRSVAHWDGDSLVVNSDGYNEGFWFSNGGLPHTRHLQLEERLTRTSLNTLEYSVTINDPGSYIRPWTSSWTLQWISGEEMPEYYCQENRL